MTEDVVRDALEKASDFIDQHKHCACDDPVQPAQDALTLFLKHILEAGPDERMYQDQIGARMVLDKSLFWRITDRLFLTHLIERLEENTNDS